MTSIAIINCYNVIKRTIYYVITLIKKEKTSEHRLLHPILEDMLCSSYKQEKSRLWPACVLQFYLQHFQKCLLFYNNYEREKNDRSCYARLFLYFVICIRQFDEDFLQNNVAFNFKMHSVHHKAYSRTSYTTVCTTAQSHTKYYRLQIKKPTTFY